MSMKDLLASDGSATAKFEALGTRIGGTITACDIRQARNFTTGEPEFWDDGGPKQQAVITVQTDLRDPAVTDDDGKRSIYVKWWGESREALKAALKAAQDDDVRPGGQFFATYSGDKASDRKGFNATKLFTYEYTQPGLGIGGEVAATPAATVQTAPAVTAAPAPAAVDPEFLAWQQAQAAAAAPAVVPVAVVAAPVVSAPPVVQAPPAPAPAAVDPAEAQAVMASIKAHMAAGWTDTQLGDPALCPQFASIPPATFAAIRNTLAS